MLVVLFFSLLPAGCFGLLGLDRSALSWYVVGMVCWGWCFLAFGGVCLRLVWWYSVLRCKVLCFRCLSSLFFYLCMNGL